MNSALKNSIDFTEAFDCPVNSPMNPEEKCDALIRNWQADNKN